MEVKQRSNLMIGLIYFVIFCGYNLFVFMVFNDYNSIFFISYEFMILAYIIHIGCAFYVKKNSTIKTVFFGVPLLSYSVYFVLAEFFCSTVFMIFKDKASVKSTILIQALLLCLFVVIFIVSVLTRETVENVDNKIKESASNIKSLNVDVEMLIERCKDMDTTKMLKRLSETIKYSDPMSNSSVATQEQMINQNMIELRRAFDSENMESVKKIANELELLFIERNKKIMVSK